MPSRTCSISQYLELRGGFQCSSSSPSLPSFGGPGPCEPLKLPTRTRPPVRERLFCFRTPVMILAGLQNYADSSSADNAVQPAHCLATWVVVGCQPQQSLVLLCPLCQWLAIGTAAVPFGQPSTPYHLGFHSDLLSSPFTVSECICEPCSVMQARSMSGRLMRAGTGNSDCPTLLVADAVSRHSRQLLFSPNTVDGGPGVSHPLFCTALTDGC